LYTSGTINPISYLVSQSCASERSTRDGSDNQRNDPADNQDSYRADDFRKIRSN
jgi:hypothetical protein